MAVLTSTMFDRFGDLSVLQRHPRCGLHQGSSARPPSLLRTLDELWFRIFPPVATLYGDMLSVLGRTCFADGKLSALRGYVSEIEKNAPRKLPVSYQTHFTELNIYKPANFAYMIILRRNIIWRMINKILTAASSGYILSDVSAILLTYLRSW
jgi:hypothetical protein